MFNERGQVYMSEQEEGLQGRLVGGSKRDGRRKYDESAKRELIQECLKPGVSIERTAMDHGINPNLVRTWISQYQREQGRVGVAGLASEPVGQAQTEIAAVAPSDEPAFVQLETPFTAAGTSQISRDVPVERCIAKRRSSRGWPGSRGGAGADSPDAREAAVFRFDEGLKVYLYRGPVDFRAGITGLSILVEQAMRLNPMVSALFVFGNRRRDRIKILGWDGNGFWLLLKRLEADRFTWPSASRISL
jgi:transposase-like protein